MARRRSSAQDDEETTASREYRIKAAYLYQFGRYVEWPAKAFANSKSPFVIGVLEQDPLIPDLEQIARDQENPGSADPDSAVLVGRRHPGVPHLVSPGVAFAGSASRGHPQDGASRAYFSWGIQMASLIGGESMQFVVEDNKIRVVISRKAAEREGLTISAKLLQVARVVD